MFLVRHRENKQYLGGGGGGLEEESRFASRLSKKMKPEFFHLIMMLVTSVQVVEM